MFKSKIFPKVAKLLTLFVAANTSALLWAQDAAAQTAPKAPVSSLMMQMPMFVLLFALFYFVAIAPQKKQQKLQQDFQKSLSKGDEVVTASGILGVVAGLTDKVVTLEVSPGTELRVLRSQVQARLKELKLSELSA